MRLVNKKILAGFCALVLCSCSSKTSKQVYRDGYRFSSNGCDTGQHNFESVNRNSVHLRLCETLTDEIINNGCAQDLRVSYFKQKCPEFSWDAMLEKAQERRIKKLGSLPIPGMVNGEDGDGGGGGNVSAASPRDRDEDIPSRVAGASSKRTYQFVDHGCDTGLHIFEAPDRKAVWAELCTALLNDKLNRGCAGKDRAQYFKEKCLP